METMMDDVTTISVITPLHCEEQNRLSPESPHQSETDIEQVFEISPVMEIQSLKGSKDAQILKMFEATIVPADLQPLEHQQVKLMEIKMSSESEVKEKGVEVKEIKDDINKRISSDRREPSKEIVETQKNQTNMAETTSKEDIEDEVEMRNISVVENIVDETEVEKEQAGALQVSLEEKEQSAQEKKCLHFQKCLCKTQQIEDQEPSPDTEEEKVNTVIQQEENSSMTYSSGSKVKHGDKRNSRCSRRLNVQAVENELTERVLRNSSKITLEATSKQVCTRRVDEAPKEKGLNQTKSQVELAEKGQVEEMTKKKYVEGKIESLSIMRKDSKDNEEERSIEMDHLGPQATDDQNLMEVQSKMEDSSQDENKIKKLRNEEQEKVTAAAEEVAKTMEDSKEIGPVDVNNAGASEIMLDGKVPEPSAAEHIEELDEDPASEKVPAEDDNDIEEATSTLKLQNVAVLVDFNNVSSKHERDDSEIEKGTSQPQEEVVQEHREQKPESTDHRNGGKEGVNQTECEPSETEQEVDMTENKHEDMEDVRDEKMEIVENIMSKIEEKFPESTFTDEKKMDEAREVEPVKQTTTNQDIPGDVPIIQDDIEASEDDGLKSDAQIELSEEEEDKTSFVTSLRRSRRLKRQVAKCELTTSVLRCTTQALKQQVRMQQVGDDPEVEQTKEVLESQTETAVEEKIESVSITTETEHMKAVEMEFEEKTPGQSAAEPVKEQEQEPASERGAAEDDHTEEATSTLKLQKLAVVLWDFEKDSTTHIDAVKDANGTLQSQEEADVELHKPESTDTESQTESTEKEQVVEMTEKEIEEWDEKVESQEGAVLNDDLKSVVADEENLEEDQKDNDTAQEVQAEEPKSLSVMESSEDDEGERSDASVKLHEEDEEEASLITPLRHSRRLKHNATESELTKRVLRRSARLANRATPQQRHKQQIKAMMLEEPDQLDESKNDEMNNILGSEIAVGELMESETVRAFAEGESEHMISAVQSICGEGSNFEKEDTEADDHKNIKNLSISHGNEVEVVYGDAEQICTSGEKSAVDTELSEVVKVQEEGAATEMVHGENEKVMEATSALMLEEASVLLLDVKKVLPLDPLDRHNTEVVEDNISVEELELGKELVAVEERENVVKSTPMLKLHKPAVVLVEFQRQTGGNETDANEMAQLQEVALLTKAIEEKALVEMDAKELVTERKEVVVVELGMDNKLITNDERDRDITAGEGVRDYSKEVKDIILMENSTSTELDTNKSLKDDQKRTPPSQGDSVLESTQDEDISVCTSKNLGRRTLPVKATPGRTSGQLQNIYKETDKTMEEESSGEEVETVFTRHLRRRTVTVTPRRRFKHRTGREVAELEMETHATKVCHEVVRVQSSDEARNGVEKTHETSSKFNSEEVPAVSEAVRKDQQQGKNLPGNDAEKVGEVNDEGTDMVEAAVETADREILASPEQRSARSNRRSRGSTSETEDKSRAQEVKEVIGEEEKKPQQKRKALVELTPRRSKRLARAEIDLMQLNANDEMN